MVAFIDDDVPVAADDFVDVLATEEALQCGDIELAVGLAPAGADLVDVSGLDAEKERQLGDPFG